MREILFRGKSNWAYGDVKEGDWLYSMTISRHCYNDEEITSYYIGGGNKTIDGKTLGQYTGLTDKDGKKIFEGDILKATDEHGRTFIYKVVFMNGIFGLVIKFGGYDCPVVHWQQNCVEVIGNIHDNPELLKGE